MMRLFFRNVFPGQVSVSLRSLFCVVGFPSRAAAVALIGLAPCLLSQAPNPTQPPPTPVQLSAPAAPPINPALPTLFIVGDSTARNQADLGWGDHLAHYFDTARINVVNRAIAGRSSRSFIAEGAWNKVLAELKPGDYVLLQMGHNDGGNLDGPKPRGSLKGLGDETKDVILLDGRTETVHTYGWYMRKYIADTRSKHATPILLTLTVRNIWTKGTDGKMHIERDMGYDALVRQIADEEHVLVADMATIEANRLEAAGPARTALLFPKDHTHTNSDGAELNAQCVVEALRRAHIPLIDDLATDFAWPAISELGSAATPPER